MNSGNNVTNDQSGPEMVFMQKQFPCIDTVTSKHRYNTNFVWYLKQENCYI